MASLLFPDDERSVQPLLIPPPPDERGPLAPDPRADAFAQATGQVYQQVSDYIAKQQRDAIDRGLWEGGQVWEGGHPTRGGLLDAARQTAEGVAMGTTSSGGGPRPPGLSLERVNPRNLRPMSGDADLTVPGAHAYTVRNPAGEHIGTVDTRWDPQTGELHIADIQSPDGANSLGAGAMKQLRATLLEQYPDARSLSGQRITGAGPNREIFQRVRPYQGRPEPVPEPPSGFTTYHGSPHKFDPTPKNPLGEFRDSAIGTGEGGQAYGMGHYAGEAEAVGLRYRDLLAAKFQSPEKTAVEDAILKEIAAGNEKAAALEAKGFDYMSPEVNAATAPHEQAVKALQDKLSAIPPTKGHVYEVRVNADQERFLNWDKPLSEQHPDVVKALKNTPYPPHDMRMSVKDYMAALETNREMATKSGDPAALASQALKEAGIPGIRYLDQDSRSAGHGTHNVVVFDPAVMEIIRRYGLAGLMLGGGGLLAPNRQER
jgi:hypothetical protein